MTRVDAQNNRAIVLIARVQDNLKNTRSHDSPDMRRENTRVNRAKDRRSRLMRSGKSYSASASTQQDLSVSADRRSKRTSEDDRSSHSGPTDSTPKQSSPTRSLAGQQSTASLAEGSGNPDYQPDSVASSSSQRVAPPPATPWATSSPIWMSHPEEYVAQLRSLQESQLRPGEDDEERKYQEMLKRSREDHELREALISSHEEQELQDAMRESMREWE